MKRMKYDWVFSLLRYGARILAWNCMDTRYTDYFRQKDKAFAD